MVNRILSMMLVFIGAMLLAPLSYSAEPIASIDRGSISIEDTLTLTIRITDTGRFGSPNTTPLEKDFHVLGTSQSSRHSIINGRSESSTEWIITLAPKRIGTLQIPSLEVGNARTGPLSVTVNPARGHTATGNEPIFLESEVSARQIYVQQQLLLTVRVFQSVQLDNMSLSDIEVENALVEKLEQTSFQRRINGRIYRVHELRYAIFPQQAGNMLIPEVVFSANEIMSQRSVFSLPGQGRPVRRLTQQYEIDVRSPPPGLTLPSGNPWLPAEDLQLLENWSSQPNEVRVGDSITRTVTIKARGLLGSQLPPIQFNPVAGARLYPDQGRVENSLSDQGASSVRTDSTAIIPTTAGELELPAITIKWWDTKQQKLKTATLPAQTIAVKPAASGTAVATPPLAVDHSGDPLDQRPVTGNERSIIWPALALIFALLWLFTVGLWLQARRASPARQPAKTTMLSSPNERESFRQLLAACKEGNSKTVRSALITWARCFWPGSSIHTLEEIARLAGSPGLSKQLQGLDRGLYAGGTVGEDWDGESLARMIREIRSNPPTSHASSDQSLPQLYANS